MDLSKLRRGELIAAVGGIVLLVAMFGLDWYERAADVSTPFGDVSVEGGGVSAWESQGFTGTIANLFILAAAVAAIGLAVVTATSRTVALPVAASALTAALGIAAVVMVLLRMILQPSQNEFVELRFGIWLALISSAVIAYGGWEAMREEGTSFEDARDQLRDRVQTGGAAPPAAPPARPAPPPPAPDAPAQPASEPPPEGEPPPESEESRPPPRPAP
jgi:hypothetical protein